ncbi:bifunctional diaminohydroxyphosphoribosylaminopyrimidine deaminase/5-amino-6-(5-phosphoribosylamino)uracil reductase RibD [Aminipila butyrica]|uniref:Riboflavin biosynthesis protein RibD n=1 Tax=Aminipila butyrica TaxID=433296 RepID=A0A858C030_9FIRM|nr:bifunctional diaminohydroxyphosphoribosylaminopyrimidine deaminase/5-amino-6-(5-phosphoribosylamino)uracil reductase RibD [Aminipila butyrica]QIB70755.1 bifunctional diaminohydroxyphosphoribosylaminopyrimidine deaminase/5-amino-6-(5-phosphoribosylamino)uracil reductase RibD [Aminipila butyrica]
MENDEGYMRLALELAAKAEGWTSPNPMVGAVIVKDGQIIGQGFHERAGLPHGERVALAACKEDPAGATLYVNLEPCCHYGRTPPCTEAILESRIARVVIGTEDPNPLVAGKGASILQKAGIQVTSGILQKECRQLNRVFFYYAVKKQPFVAMKYAMTMDGKIAAHTGLSRWITGPVAREHVHQLRHRYASILVGIGTVLADNPRLDCRLPNTKNPKRIICDSQLRLPLDSQIAVTAGDIETYVATASDDKEKSEALRRAGCTLWYLPGSDGRVDLAALMKRLGENEIDSVLLEGGGTLNYQALNSGLVDYIYAYIAPKILGGRNALTPVEGLGRDCPTDSILLRKKKVTLLGEDLLIEQEVSKAAGHV